MHGRSAAAAVLLAEAARAVVASAAGLAELAAPAQGAEVRSERAGAPLAPAGTAAPVRAAGARSASAGERSGPTVRLSTAPPIGLMRLREWPLGRPRRRRPPPLILPTTRIPAGRFVTSRTIEQTR